MRNEKEISVGVFMLGSTPPGTSLALAGTDPIGSFETVVPKLYVGLKGKFWSARYPKASCRSLYMPKPARMTVLGLKGLQATPMRGCGKNLALLVLKRESPTCGVLLMTPLVKK